MIAGKEERFALAVLASVLAVILLSGFILSQAEISPQAFEYSNSSAKGDMVYYEGEVLEVSKTRTGGHLLIKTDGPDIFAAEGESLCDVLEKGDFIYAKGRLSSYNGKEEIYIENPDNIRITG